MEGGTRATRLLRNQRYATSAVGKNVRTTFAFNQTFDPGVMVNCTIVNNHNALLPWEGIQLRGLTILFEILEAENDRIY